MLGHDGPPPPGSPIKRHLITDEPLERCPVRTIQLAHEARQPAAAEFARYDEYWYPQWKAGDRFNHRGTSEQPARYLDIINLFREVESVVETKLIEITKPKTNPGE